MLPINKGEPTTTCVFAFFMFVTQVYSTVVNSSFKTKLAKELPVKIIYKMRHQKLTKLNTASYKSHLFCVFFLKGYFIHIFLKDKKKNVHSCQDVEAYFESWCVTWYDTASSYLISIAKKKEAPKKKKT